MKQMTSTIKIHRLIALLTNALIIALIIYFVYKTNSDKSPVIFMLFYPVLIILNVIAAIIFLILKKPVAFIYQQIILVLILLFLPLIFLLSTF